MTYLRNGTEYLSWPEWRVHLAVARLSELGRAANNSQLARATGISRTTVSGIVRDLAARGFLRDAGKGAAYHWRTTDKTPQLEARS